MGEDLSFFRYGFGDYGAVLQGLGGPKRAQVGSYTVSRVLLTSGALHDVGPHVVFKFFFLSETIFVIHLSLILPFHCL